MRAPRYYLFPVGLGIVGTMATARKMERMARAGSCTEPVRRLAAGLRTVSNLRRFLAASVRFEFDPPGHELVVHPAMMVEEIERDGYTAGDCDDVATLGASLALALGLRVRFALVRFEPGGEFLHVYTEVGSGAGWAELDTTRPYQYEDPRDAAAEIVYVDVFPLRESRPCTVPRRPFGPIPRAAI